jgi:hypothetical protein
MQIEFFETQSVDKDNKYSKKVLVPQYLPSDKCPLLNELYSTAKYSELMADIKNSSVSDEEKTFLMRAATRHIVFNYSKIADYYAHATPEMQKLMEQSALVIIDVNDAIANGYVKLSSEIKKMIEENSL